MARFIVAAAVKTDDGVIHFMPRPNRHHHTVHALHRMLNGGDGLIIEAARGEQGFVTSDGMFVDRKDGAAVALQAGQIERLQHPPNLYSEDLW